MPTEALQPSVVIPARDAETTLARTLDALAAQTVGAPAEVIVVDDGSTDRTAEIARHHPLDVRVVEGAGIGPGGARNEGVALARGRILAFTDADCFPAADWLERGLEAIANRDLVQGRVVPDAGVPRRPYDRTLVVERENGYYQTANLFVRRDLFQRIGGFDDWVSQGGAGALRGWHRDSARRPSRPVRRGEDALFGWQARRLGARVGFAPQVLVRHAVFPRTPSQAIRDRWAMRHVPALARRLPEMREAAFYRRWFFDRRSAFFDAAVAGALLAAALRRPAPLIAALPYVRLIAREAAGTRGDEVRTAATMTAGDAVACAALAVGSVGWRAPLI